MEKRYDIWRDSPVRLFGYANEVGESFRYIFPRIVLPSYILSISYVCCDAIDKGYLQYKIGIKLYILDNYLMTKNIFYSFFHSIIW